MEGSSQCFRSRWSTSASNYICAHPCSLTLERTPITTQRKDESTQETQQHQQQQHNQERQHTAYEADSEEEIQQQIQTHDIELKMIRAI